MLLERRGVSDLGKHFYPTLMSENKLIRMSIRVCVGGRGTLGAKLCGSSRSQKTELQAFPCVCVCVVCAFTSLCAHRGGEEAGKGKNCSEFRETFCRCLSCTLTCHSLPSTGPEPRTPAFPTTDFYGSLCGLCPQIQPG